MKKIYGNRMRKIYEAIIDPPDGEEAEERISVIAPTLNNAVNEYQPCYLSTSTTNLVTASLKNTTVIDDVNHQKQDTYSPKQELIEIVIETNTSSSTVNGDCTKISAPIIPSSLNITQDVSHHLRKNVSVKFISNTPILELSAETLTTQINEWAANTQAKLLCINYTQVKQLDEIINHANNAIKQIQCDLQRVIQSIETYGPITSGIHEKLLQELNKLEISYIRKIDDLNNQFEIHIAEIRLDAMQLIEQVTLDASLLSLINEIINKVNNCSQNNFDKYNEFRKKNIADIDEIREMISVFIKIFIKNQVDKLDSLRNIFKNDSDLKVVKKFVNIYKNKFKKFSYLKKNMNMIDIIKFCKKEFEHIKEDLNKNKSNYLDIPDFKYMQDLIDEYCCNYEKLSILVNLFAFLEKNPILRKKHNGLSRIYELFLPYANVEMLDHAILYHPENTIQLNQLLFSVQSICLSKVYPNDWIDILKYKFSHSHFSIFKSKRDSRVDTIYRLIADLDDSLTDICLMEFLHQNLQFNEAQRPISLVRVHR